MLILGLNNINLVGISSLEVVDLVVGNDQQVGTILEEVLDILVDIDNLRVVISLKVGNILREDIDLEVGLNSLVAFSILALVVKEGSSPVGVLSNLDMKA